MSERDWQVLQKRRSCNLLTRAEMEGGRTPTTPTISSIIAGVQCQEAVKLLHDLPVMAGRGWVFDGWGTDAYQVEYQRKPECYSHEIFEAVQAVPASAATWTVAEALIEARRQLGSGAELELPREILAYFACPQCGSQEEVFASLGSVRAERAVCPHCADVRRDVTTFYRIRGDEPFLDRTLSAIGVPPYEILIARLGDRTIGLELAHDAAAVLGPLFVSQEVLEWL